MIDLPLERPEGMSDQDWNAYLQRALKLIKSFTPVRTGRLRDGWTIGDLGLQNDVPYAEFVNDGTPRMSARDMTGRTLGALR